MDGNRLRFVKPGYDAGSSGVPAEAVVFDSDAQFNLMLWRAGEWSSTNNNASGTIATWPSLGYPPLVTTQVSVNGGGWTPYVKTGEGHLMIISYHDRLVVDHRRMLDFTSIAVRWQAYLLAAVS